MDFNFAIVKKHPLVIGGSILVLGGIVFYLIVRRSSSASGTDLSSSSADFLATMAASQAQAAGYNAALQNSQIQAQVASLAIEKQAETQQAAIAAQQQTTLGVAQTQSETITTLASTQAEIEAAKTAAYAQIEKDFIPLIEKKYPGSSTGVVQIIAALQGQGPEALALTNPGAYGGSGFGINIPGVGGVNVGIGG